MKLIIMILAILLISLLMPQGSCSGYIATDGAARGSDEEDAAPQNGEALGKDVDLADESRQVDELFSSISQEGPGGAVIVIKDGQVLKESGYGLADIEKGTPVTTQTLFHLGSVGKQFTAIGIMMLAEEGKIKYDDPIGKHLPELSWCGSDLTIRDLLHHTSGITGYDEDDSLRSELSDVPGDLNNKDLIAALSKPRSPQFRPGDKFSYSNTGYDILGALIERISGKSYSEFMQSRIFGPLGMTHTFAMPNPGREVAVSYEMSGGSPAAEKSDPLDNLSGSGSIYSSVEDMHLYDQALYTDELVKQSTLDEAFKPAVLNDGTESRYGFGFELDPYNGEELIAHSGAWLAFSSEYMRFPQRRLSIIVLLNENSGDGAEGLGHKIADIYLKDSQSDASET